MTIAVRRAATFGLRYGTATLRSLPHFLVIGAQRAGTTSLYECLVRHPDVVPAFRKEVHFFDVNFHRGARWYRANFALRRHLAATHRSGRIRITGDATPYYLFHPAVPARVASLLPRVRLIALLRNPVDRAYSHYLHARRRGHETLGFEEALAQEATRLAGEAERLATMPRYRSHHHVWHSYVGRGLYAEQLERWFRHVPRDRVLVLQTERLVRDTASLLDTALDFLGLARHPLVLEHRNSNDYPAPLAPETRARLVETFRPHNRRLAELLGTAFEWDR